MLKSLKMISNSQKKPKLDQPDEKPSSSTTSSKPYNQWIHCNACYEQYMLKRRSFYIHACDHVTCQQCMVEVKNTEVNGPTIFKCPLCRKQTRACKMGNDMPSHLKELFHPEPYLDGLNTYRIMVFQDKHRRRFMDYLDRQYLVIQEQKKEAQKDRELAKKYYQELEVTKAERKRLEKRVIAIKNQRKEMEEKRNSAPSVSTNSLSYSSSSNATPTTRRPNVPVPKVHSSGPRMPRPTGSLSSSSGVTSFSQHPSNSFRL